MCIKIENYSNKQIEDIKKKLKNNIDNPKLEIEEVKINNKILNIVQDGKLIAGTKQRVAKLFIKNIKKKNPEIESLVYSGTYNGYGAVATAYSANKLNLKCDIFLSKKNEKQTIKELKKTRQIITLIALGANINICDDYNKAKIAKYNLCDNENKKQKKEYYIVPMGLNDEDGIMIDLLSKQIIKATKKSKIEKIKKRIWLVSGSGGIAMSIKKAYPEVELNILLTGGYKYKKRIIEWAKTTKNVKIIENEELKKKFNYYSSVKNYNDLIIPYIEKYAEDNDIIWNVSSDDFI